MISFFFLFFFSFYSLIYLPVSPALPDPTPLPVQPFLPSSSPAVTIPANPEQSDFTSCPLDLPDELFDGIRSACSGKHKSGELHRIRCCPVLAAWLYAAYSSTALGSAGKAPKTAAYGDLPQLPDDSETCVDSLQRGLKNKGIELMKPNETCDIVYCYCGIRLHPLSCPSAFSVSENTGKLVGNKNVHRLETNCLSNGVTGFPGLDRCSNCLNSLSLLNEEKTKNISFSEDRTTKMQNRDCDLMGLTWLLAKNRSAYINTVPSVFRAIMMTPDGTNPPLCTLSSDGKPLAVDSSELNNPSSSPDLHSSLHLCLAMLCLLYINFAALLTSY